MGAAPSNHLNIANTTGYTVKVLVAPNMDWVLADIFIGVATIALDGYGVVTTFNDLWRIWNAISFQKDAISMAVMIHNALDKHMFTIDPGHVRDIFDHTLINPLDYLTASGWAALCGGSEMSLVVFLMGPGDTMKMVAFNSNSDWSWIVHDDQVNRSKYGKLWQDDGNVKKFVANK